MHVPVALSRSHMHNETLRHKHSQTLASCSSIKDHLWCRGIFQRNLGLRGWWVDWVRDIVLNMHGQDLTALKNAMDDGGDAHNIHKLIYNDILVSFRVLQPFVETDMSCSRAMHLCSYMKTPYLIAVLMPPGSLCRSTFPAKHVLMPSDDITTCFKV